MLSLHDVLYSPELKSNFLSVSRLISKECTVEFSEESAKVITAKGVEILRAKRNGDLFTFKERQNVLCVATKTIAQNLFNWHRKYGHLNMKSLE